MLKKRHLTPYVIEDLAEKMVFISGPRQVGKTTLSKEIVSHYFKSAAYYNWDFREDRRIITESQWPTDANLIILDEIHKYRRWKTLVKGNYDKWKDRYKFLVTGSARLNIFSKGGDSLQGRYHSYRLHPFTFAECLGNKNQIEAGKEISFPETNSQNELNMLMEYGGFPEPLVKQSDRHLRRWHHEKLDRLFREDIRELEQIRDLSSMELLSDLLPSRVGSLLSLNSLREDLEVSHRAVSHWMDILENFYYHFRIPPYSSRKIRSIKKEPKLYLWDWSEVKSEGVRFENLVAMHLLKLVHFLQDYQGYQTELRFLRDKEKREVDFLVLLDRKPWFACEAKIGDESVSRHLLYFKERLNIPFSYQVVLNGKKDTIKEGIRILPANKFLAGLL